MPYIRLSFNIILTIAAAAIIAGCSDSESVGESEYVYVAETVQLPSSSGFIYSTAYYSGKVYYVVIGDEIISGGELTPPFSTSGLYSMNIDGTANVKLPGYVPPVAMPKDAGGQVAIQNMAIDGEGFIWVIEGWVIYRYDLPDNFDMEEDDPTEFQEINDTGTVLRKLDAEGEQLLSIDIDNIRERDENLFITAMTAGGSADDTTLYLACAVYGTGTTIYTLSSDGDIKCRLSTPQFITGFNNLPDGTVAAVPDPVMSGSSLSNRQAIPQRIDLSAKALGDVIEIPGIGGSVGTGGELAYNVKYYSGGGGYDIVFSTASSLYGYVLGSGETVKLLDWLECNVIINSIEDVYITDNGKSAAGGEKSAAGGEKSAAGGEQIICVNLLWGETQSTELIVLTKTPRSQLPEKKTLTLAMFGYIDSRIENAVVNFNKTNLEYAIEIKDYSHSSDGAWSAGDAQLMTEIAAGIVPDIMDTTSYLPYRELAEKGLLADLYPFIDSDPELERSGFVQAAIKAYEIDGGLYQAFDSFMINTIICPPSVAGRDMWWTVEECIEVLDAHSDADIPFGTMITKTVLLMWAMGFDIDRYIDWETGTVHFDSPEFVRFLELCNRFPDDVVNSSGSSYVQVSSEESFSTGRQIGSLAIVSDFFVLRNYSELLGGEFVFKGYPSVSRAGHSINAQNCLAIAEQSEHKEAAWSFVQQLLTEDWQRAGARGMLPTNQAAFDYALDTALEGIYTVYINGMPDEDSEKLQITQKEADNFLALLEAVSSLFISTDSTLRFIIMEEAANYFNGICSAQDAARIIQGKVSIFISERS